VASAGLSRWNFPITPWSRKNSERSPRIAKMFEVKTMNGSVVMAKIAGIESTANTRSVHSIRTRTIRSGVA
jgi:hypothetical protein